MIWTRLLASLVVTVLVCCACTKQASTEAAPPEHTLPTEAQPHLATTKLWLGPAEVTAEIARTRRQIETGMMFRTNIAENAGMLFVFPGPSKQGFWMMNCPLPLSCAYINPEGIIEEIHHMEPYNTNSIVSDSDNIMFVLEMAQGWYASNDITPGMLVRTDKGSLVQTFFQPRTR